MTEDKITAPISEIFYSYQGEGIFVGAPQIFIRFRKCNLDCRYCDTDKEKLFGYFSPVELKSELNRLNRREKKIHSLSLTGGEPLLYAEFLRRFLPLAKDFRIYLETNGTLPEALNKIIDYVDIVAMDIKLPSSTGGAPLWNEHLRFLRCAVKSSVFVKLIITADTIQADVDRAEKTIETINPEIPVVLQPEYNSTTPHITDFQRNLSRGLADVRVIPQVHKLMGVR